MLPQSAKDFIKWISFSLTLSSAFGGHGRKLSNSFATTCSLCTRSPLSAIGGRRQTLCLFRFFLSPSPLSSSSSSSSHCVCYTQPKNRHVQRVHCTKIRLILIVCVQHDVEFTYPISFRRLVSCDRAHIEDERNEEKKWTETGLTVWSNTRARQPTLKVLLDLFHMNWHGAQTTATFFLIVAVQAQRNRFAIMSYFLFRMKPVSHFSFLHLHKRCRKHPREKEKTNTRNAK